MTNQERKKKFTYLVKKYSPNPAVEKLALRLVRELEVPTVRAIIPAIGEDVEFTEEDRKLITQLFDEYG